MRDPVAAAGLQHAGAAGHPDHPPVGIAEPDRPALDLRQGPRPARQNDRRDERRVGQEHPVPDPGEPRHLIGQADMHGLERHRPPGGILRQGADRPAALREAQQRDDRHQHRERQQPRCRAREAGLQPEPEVQARAAVDPGDDQHGHLHRAEHRGRHPEGVEFLRIALVETLGDEGDPGAGDVADQQRRDQEAGDQLQDLGAPQAEEAVRVERLEPERDVDQQRAVQERQAQGVEPEGRDGVETVLHGGEGDVAQRVVGQVGQHVAEQHQAAGQPEAAQGQGAARPGGGGGPAILRPRLDGPKRHAR